MMTIKTIFSDASIKWQKEFEHHIIQEITGHLYMKLLFGGPCCSQNLWGDF